MNRDVFTRLACSVSFAANQIAKTAGAFLFGTFFSPL